MDSTKSLLDCILLDAPSPTNDQRHCIQEVAKKFNFEKGHSANVSAIAKLAKFTLVQAITLLEITHYNQKIDVKRINRLKSKCTLSEIICNKLNSFFPQICNGCQSEYTIPAVNSDQNRNLRRFCEMCGTPSHHCHQIISSEIIHWICHNCTVKNAGPHTKFLCNDIQAVTQANPSTCIDSISVTPSASTSCIASHPPSMQPPPQMRLRSSSNPPTPHPSSSTELMCSTDHSQSGQSVALSSPLSSQIPSSYSITPSKPLQLLSTPTTPLLPSSPSSTLSQSTTPCTSVSQKPLPALSLPSATNDSVCQTVPISTSIPSALSSPTSLTLSSTMQTQSISSPSQSSIPLSYTSSPPSRTNHNHNTKWERNICPFLKDGMCKYGLNGRKGGFCRFFHPKTCPTFIEHGETNPNGCHNGVTCELWHPTYLCRNSVKYMFCDRVACKYTHLRNCKRPYSHENSQNAPQKRFNQRVDQTIPPLMSVSTTHTPKPSRKNPWLHSANSHPFPSTHQSQTSPAHFYKPSRLSHWPRKPLTSKPHPHHRHHPPCQSPKEMLSLLVPLLQNLVTNLS